MKKITMVLAVVCLFSAGFSRMAAAQDPDANVTGNYVASLYMTLAAHQFDSHTPDKEKIVKEQWTFKQEGKKVTGTEKTEKAELPITGSIEGNTLRGFITDGQQRYLINVNVDPDDGAMHGTIRMGIHEYLLNLAKAK
jgi:hypothetical protein